MPHESAATTDRLDIRPLTADTWNALASLFSQGGDPKWCWCAFWRKRGLDWTNSTADSNRALLRSLVDAADGRDDAVAPGLLALRDGQAVGWVGLGPRDAYERLTYSQLLAPVDDKPVWSIVCFVVARRERGKGVAKALLDAAIDYAREHGATMLEAYPVDTTEGRIPAASAYTGTASMFERARFAELATRRFNATSRPRHIYRRGIRRRAQRRRPVTTA